MRIYINENFDETAYKKWKKANVTLRGINPDNETLDQPNSGFARFGAGLYTVPLSNKAMAKQYGDVYFVVNGRPKNPVVFRNVSEAEAWIYNVLIKNFYKRIGYEISYSDSRQFYKMTTIKDEMLRLGYDGIEIKGREMVNYTPEDIMFFQNERQLIMYYENQVELNMI